MSQFRERHYRQRAHSKDLVSFQVMVKETDLWVSAGAMLETETRDLVFGCRHQIETYIDAHPAFAISLSPYPEDPYAPPLVREMIEVTRPLGVGPMASVAGAIAQYVATGLLEKTDRVIVENGGDIFLSTHRPATVGIFAGESPLSERVGLEIAVEQMPLGVCSSSGTIGHSLSTGIADVVCIISPSGALADGAATALGNRIRRKDDLEDVGGWAGDMEGVLGGVVIVGDRIAAWGDVKLVGL